MVSARHFISKSSSPFNNPSVTVPSAPTTTAIHVTFLFDSFLHGQGTYLSFLFLSILLCDEPGLQSPQFCNFSDFFIIIIWSSGWD